MQVMMTEEEKAHSQQRQRLSLANGGLCSLSSVNMLYHHISNIPPHQTITEILQKP
jgi:hypothetical protein